MVPLSATAASELLRHLDGMQRALVRIGDNSTPRDDANSELTQRLLAMRSGFTAPPPAPNAPPRQGPWFGVF